MAGADATAVPLSSTSSDWQVYPALSLHPILDAALTEFQQNGYHGTTVRAIATGAGLTMPSLYYHYGSKEGILFALLDVAMDDLQGHIEAGLLAGDDTVVKFKNFITSVVFHYTYRQGLATLHREFRFLGPELRAEYVLRRASVERTLEDLLRTGIAEGRFSDDDARFTSRVLLGMLSGILNWYQEGGPLAATEISDRYARDALRLVLTADAG